MATFETPSSLKPRPNGPPGPLIEGMLLSNEYIGSLLWVYRQK